jgi:parvulin-like peptidyl-prolyl isomerase
MRPHTLLVALVFLALVALAPPGTAEKQSKKKKNKNPDVVTVQHVLISFKGKTDKPVERSKKQADKLAWDIFDRAEAGEDFDALVKEYTDDSYPGTYKMTNRGAARLSGHTPRDNMAVSFGDVSFKLDVGEIGMARFHAELSPFGWHIIKRLE